MYVKLVIPLLFSLISVESNSLFFETDENDFGLLLQEIMLKNLAPYKCVVIISDELYSKNFRKSWFAKFGAHITFILVNVEAYEDLFSPNYNKQLALSIAKDEGCQMYIILLSNGLQVSRLLQFGDRYRVINTRAKFLFLYDNRLFEKDLFYLWKRIINVIFIRRYSGQKNQKDVPWFELTTVPFPTQISTVFVPRRLDIWTLSKFRKGTDLFRDKTSDLKNQTLRVVSFSHIPATTRNLAQSEVRTIIGNFSGTEIEILKTFSAAINFNCEIYEAPGLEMWGTKQSGLIGEMVTARADIALGDLYYTPYYLNLMDLSVPYNTECLTFLTPESLTDNSWKTLILPFKGLMWAMVLISLLVSGTIFWALARFHETITNKTKVEVVNTKPKIITLSLYSLDVDEKYAIFKEQYQNQKLDPNGLYQFSEPVNSILYTYSMLLLVSLPKLPTGWSLRVLTGWYWLYSLLLVVAYRASMTAILARPSPRVTIDTLQELINSELKCGGWGDVNRDFFTSSSLDPLTKTIGQNFELINDSTLAVDRVAEGRFAFYENSYFLKEALVKRQLRFQIAQSNSKQSEEDRYLHIMTDCVIKMPISIGLQKNSPIKPRVDKFIRRVLEAGLVKKWLDDVMSPILTAEVHGERKEETKAIMSMKKFFGAIVALFVGYFFSVVALIVEILYFQYSVKKNPKYNKYSRTIKE